MGETSPIDRLVAAARGDPASLEDLLARYRPYLVLVGQRRLGARVAVRCDASDVAQQTLADAYRHFTDFQGTDEAAFSAWLRTIHLHNLDEAARRHVLAETRSVRRELPLDPAEGSTSLLWFEPSADQTTPSQRAIEGETALRLASLLEALPEMQREAVRLKHLEGWTLDEIAAELGKTPAAVVGLLKRGMRALREKLADETGP